MRVLHVDTGRRMQGGQWQVLYLLRGLRDRGVHCDVLAKGELASKLSSEGFPLARSGAYDLIHAHDAHAHSWAWLRRLGPLVVSRRVGFPVKTGLLSRWKYGYPAAYIAISQYVSTTLARPAAIVHDGVPELPRQPGERQIVIFDKRRGDQLRLDDLSRAAVFVYLTDMDGLGSAALLAMSAGIPVIASNVGGVPEAVIHQQTGLLVDNSPASVKEAIDYLAAHPALSFRLGEAGRQRWREHFTVDEMVEGTLAVYRDVLAPSSRQ